MKKSELKNKVMKNLSPIFEDILKETDGNYLITFNPKGDWMNQFSLIVVGCPHDEQRLVKKVGRYRLYLVTKGLDKSHTELITTDTAVGCWIESQLEDNQVDDVEFSLYYI